MGIAAGRVTRCFAPGWLPERMGKARIPTNGQATKKLAMPAFWGVGDEPIYLTCLPIRPAISNIDTWGLPKTSLSLASALIMRLFASSCSLLALM